MDLGKSRDGSTPTGLRNKSRVATRVPMKQQGFAGRNLAVRTGSGTYRGTSKCRAERQSDAVLECEISDSTPDCGYLLIAIVGTLLATP